MSWQFQSVILVKKIVARHRPAFKDRLEQNLFIVVQSLSSHQAGLTSANLAQSKYESTRIAVISRHKPPFR
jgi:hypothetical protein